MDLQQNIEATIADFNLNDMPAGRTAKRIMQLIKEDKCPQAAPEDVSAGLAGSVEKATHAEIKRGEYARDHFKQYDCPKCKYVTLFIDYKFCPKCGVNIKWVV